MGAGTCVKVVKRANTQRHTAFPEWPRWGLKVMPFKKKERTKGAKEETKKEKKVKSQLSMELQMRPFLAESSGETTEWCD